MQNSPSCNCCCVSETYTFSDPAIPGWTQVSGVWTVDDQGGTVTPSATTTDADAILIKDDSQSSGSWLLRITLMVGGSYGVAVRARAFFGWQDASNYWYAEQIDDPTFLALSQLRVVQVSGGVPTVRLDVGTSGWNTYSGWYICYQNGFLCLNGGSASPAGYTFVLEAEVAAGKIGIGKGDKSVHVVQVNYDRNCYDCLTGTCCEGYDVPDYVTINISGLTGDYAAWNGAYVLHRSYVPITCAWVGINVLDEIPGGHFTDSVTVQRITNTQAVVTLSYTFTFGGTSLIFSATIDLPADAEWTISPCNDKWGELPADLLDESDNVVGSVDSITAFTW